MVFSSISFLFFILPLFLVGFHLLPAKLKLPFLLVSSLFFYFWGENYLVWILVVSTSIDYLSSLLIADGFKKSGPKKLLLNGHRSRKQKIGLAISIFSNLGFLAYFKYYNFFFDNFIAFTERVGIDFLMSEQTAKVALPLGISFYTFQSMSYTIDVYRGKVTATKSFIRFASFVSMFPQLVAGPIVRYSDIEEQINHHKITLDGFVIGLNRFIVGLAKKVIIADTMAVVADHIFALPANELSTGLAWLGVFAYSLQIFYDFSGYSCMAIGLGRMIGFTFPENFNYPFISRSIREFWNRWHISLSTWFRDYLYFPLGGSKKGGFTTYRNLFIVFSVCGLWHGASWNFVLWGMFHGVFLVIERLPFIKRYFNFPRVFEHIYAMLVLNIGWALFRPETLSESWVYLNALFGNTMAETQLSSFGAVIRKDTVIVIILGLLFSTPFTSLLKNKLKSINQSIDLQSNYVYYFIMLFLLFLSVMRIATSSYSPFIYFRF